MTRPCSVPRCPEPAAGHGILCEAHRKTARRHGHPLQTATSAARLKPHRERVQARREKNAGNALWSILEARWGAIQTAAEAILAQYAAGQPCVRHELQAAQQVHILAGAVDPRSVVDTVLSMFLLQEDDPRAFRDDRAFQFQVVRRVRALTDLNAGSYWDNDEKRTKRVYRDMPPRAVEVLAEWLVQAFGQAGLILARKEQEERQAAQADAEKLARALEELK